MSIPEVGFAERVLLSRVLLCAVMLGIVAFGAMHPEFAKTTWRRFWYATGHPINLAVYRIVLFATIFWDLDGDYPLDQLVFFSQLPAELRFAPRGLEWITPHVPMGPGLAVTSYVVLRVCALSAMLGLFSRTSAGLVAIVGVYTLGVPQLFGQVNHYHHMLWFAAVLACSRCGDVLSLDSLIFAWRRADRGIIAPPPPAREYALPLRIVWILMGVVYFFPGFWKVWVSGIDWALGDGFRNLLHMKWHQLDGWTPAWRLDRYPLLYRPAALMAMLFELSFMFLVLFPKGRWLALVTGLTFHNMTNMLMRIPFFTLQTSYVSLVEWDRVCRWVGRRLYPEVMYVLYDGNCGLCRRTIGALRRFDVFERIEYVNVLATGDGERYMGIERARLMVDMHAVLGQRAWRGFAAYRAMAARIPLLWGIWPVLWMWPVAAAGRRAYRHVADGRSCALPGAGPGWPRELGTVGGDGVGPVIAVGLVLILANVAYGVRHQRSGWPFSCYPPFSRIAPRESVELDIAAFTADGALMPWNERTLMKRFSYPRYTSLMERLSERRDAARYRALWRVVVAHSPEVERAGRVEFYRDSILTDPEHRARGPVRRELVYLMELKGEEAAGADGRQANGRQGPDLSRPPALGGAEWP